MHSEMKDEVKLPQYLDILIQNGYECLETITAMQMDDFVDIRISKRGHRQRLSMHIQRLKNLEDHRRARQITLFWEVIAIAVMVMVAAKMFKRATKMTQKRPVSIHVHWK